MLQIICPIHGPSDGIFTTQGMICQVCLAKMLENDLLITEEKVCPQENNDEPRIV